MLRVGFSAILFQQSKFHSGRMYNVCNQRSRLNSVSTKSKKVDVKRAARISRFGISKSITSYRGRKAAAIIMKTINCSAATAIALRATDQWNICEWKSEPEKRWRNIKSFSENDADSRFRSPPFVCDGLKAADVDNLFDVSCGLYLRCRPFSKKVVGKVHVAKQNEIVFACFFPFRIFARR